MHSSAPQQGEDAGDAGNACPHADAGHPLRAEPAVWGDVAMLGGHGVRPVCVARALRDQDQDGPRRRRWV